MNNIFIDIYKTKNMNSGLGQFSYNYAREISNIASADYNLNFLIPKNFKTWTKENIKFHKTTRLNKFSNNNNKIDIWHSLHQFPTYLPDKNTKLILTIHDLNFLLEKNPYKALKYLKKLQKNVDRASAVTFVSEYTKKIAKENLDFKNKALYKIYNGVKLNSFSDTTKPDFIKNNNFFFCLGIISAKKNFHTLIPLMHHFKDFQLIIAGNKNSKYAKEIEQQINALKLNDRICLPGNINDKEKYWLYSNCKAFLFPSLSEGFGLPVIEAMLVGKPVFLSKHTSLPEIGGELAFYWDNFKTDYMAEIIKNKLNYFDENPQLSDDIIKYANKFSWEDSIKNYLKIYDNFVKNT